MVSFKSHSLYPAAQQEGFSHEQSVFVLQPGAIFLFPLNVSPVECATTSLNFVCWKQHFCPL